jgi:hypothetical protein
MGVEGENVCTVERTDGGREWGRREKGRYALLVTLGRSLGFVDLSHVPSPGAQ